MSTTLTFGQPTGMEHGIWAIKFGTTIAKNVPEGMRFVQEPDGMRLYIIGSLPFAGYLAQQVNAMLPTNAPFEVFSQWDGMPDDAAPGNANAFECDDMYNAMDGSVGNASFEITADGNCQIVDKNGAWQNIGFNPGFPPSNVWTPCSVQSHIDPIAKLTSVKQIQVGTRSTSVPALMQGIPFFNFNPPWAKVSQMVKQVQPSVTANGGAWSVKVRNMITAVTY